MGACVFSSEVQEWITALLLSLLFFFSFSFKKEREREKGRENRSRALLPRLECNLEIIFYADDCA